MADEAMAEGVDYFRPEKTIHKSFFLDTFENLTKDWPGGSVCMLNRPP